MLVLVQVVLKQIQEVMMVDEGSDARFIYTIRARKKRSKPQNNS